MTDLTLQCECGQVTREITEISPTLGNHLFENGKGVTQATVLADEGTAKCSAIISRIRA